ncbi:MAG: aminoacyl-tRNA hydrolase [Elusimicrobiota bacterium]|jgi:PTH1 family peptidyl-tRNA hydrolase|nr:aminoacyl-tRNA hydrolase [Elusimicrobiota bacterium]
MQKKFLIAGIGNPGAQYANTRHNAGFMAADIIAEHFGVEFTSWPRAKTLYCKNETPDKTVYILKPQTYMNLSGQAVFAFANFYKIPTENILIIFDDMSLPLGSLRMRGAGSSGGHNGMQNIIEQFGTQNMVRLRIGIGPKPDFFEGKDFVLSKFSRGDQTLLKPAFERALQAAVDFVNFGVDAAMNKANQK